MKLCQRCNDSREAVHEATAPCGCLNFFCDPCYYALDFGRWLKGYSKLHARVGGRCVGGRFHPCPTGPDLQAPREPAMAWGSP